MNQSAEAVVDLEAATDQLVDELCNRLTALYGLLGTTLTETGPAVESVRAQATELACRLHGSQSTATAASIARALWSPQPGTQVPRSWWATPLGAVIAAAVSTPQPAHDRDDGTAVVPTHPDRRTRS